MSEEQPQDHPESSPLVNATEQRIKNERPDDWIRSLAEAVRTIIIVVGLAYLLRLFVFQPYIVDGSSMAPNLATNDYLIVSKLDYRFNPPSRGDVIVFDYPNDPTIKYVKRVIGLPGEKVVIEDGVVHIFNSAHPNGFILDESQYLNTSVKTTLPATENDEFTVTDGHYFVLGDNRPASSDSREWGLLPQDDLIGRVVLRAFPFSDTEIFHHITYPGN